MSKSESSAHRVPPYKRPLLVGGFLAVLAIVIIVTIVLCKNFLGNKNDDSSHLPSSDNSQTSDPEPPVKQPSPDDDVENKTPQYEGEDPNDLSELTGVIIYKDIDPETNTLHSAVSINQYLQDDGQCVYNLKRDGAIVRTASAIATPDVTTSVCGPFNISVADLSGPYQIEVIITGGGKTGVINDEVTF